MHTQLIFSWHKFSLSLSPSLSLHLFPQLHYLLYGSGFQTWEYSPAYALRSYGYITLHQLPMLLSRGTNKVT